MLTPEQVNAYAGLLAAPWDELNERILRDMVRRIVKAGGVTATAEWQSYRAQALGASKAYLIQQMNLIVQQIGPKEAAIFAQAMKQAYGIDVNDAAKAGRVLPTLGENEEAQQIVQSGYRRTMNTLYNLTQTRALMGNLNMTETSQRQLAYYLDMAHADAISGAFSSDAAARRALNELATKGLGAITYPSGHVDTLDVVVLRATRTGVNQTAGEITRYNADTLECDLMELDAHVGARTGNGGPNLTNHSWWQGQLVSRSGQHGYLSLSDIGYGDVRGFMGANCAHNWSMYWEGASTRSYSPERLERINSATVSYNGKEIGRYKATQMQRAQERQIRADKRAFLVAKESGQKDAEKAAGRQAGSLSCKDERLSAADRAAPVSAARERARLRAQRSSQRGSTGEKIRKPRRAAPPGFCFIVRSSYPADCAASTLWTAPDPWGGCRRSTGSLPAAALSSLPARQDTARCPACCSGVAPAFR